VIDRTCPSIHADLSNPVQTVEALRKALLGSPITRLVNNVGMVPQVNAEHQVLAQFDAVYTLNLRCALQCMQALLSRVKKAGFGRIVNLIA